MSRGDLHERFTDFVAGVFRCRRGGSVLRGGCVLGGSGSLDDFVSPIVIPVGRSQVICGVHVRVELDDDPAVPVALTGATARRQRLLATATAAAVVLVVVVVQPCLAATTIAWMMTPLISPPSSMMPADNNRRRIVLQRIGRDRRGGVLRRAAFNHNNVATGPPTRSVVRSLLASGELSPVV